MAAHTCCYDTPTVMWEAETREQDGGLQTSQSGERRGIDTWAAWGVQGHRHLGSLGVQGHRHPGSLGRAEA